MDMTLVGYVIALFLACIFFYFIGCESGRQWEMARRNLELKKRRREMHYTCSKCGYQFIMMSRPEDKFDASETCPECKGIALCDSED